MSNKGPETRWAVHFGRNRSRPQIMSEDAAIAGRFDNDFDRDLYANTWRCAENGCNDDGPTWVVEAPSEVEALQLALAEFRLWCADSPEGGAS